MRQAGDLARHRVDPHKVAVAQSRQRAALCSLGRDVDRGRHLARGAGHAAVGDERHLESPILQHRQRGREPVQFGHAVGRGTLEAHYHDGVLGELAGLERGLHRLLVVEDPRLGLDHVPGGIDGGGLHHAVAEIAGELLEPAGLLERVQGRAQDLVVLGLARGVLVDHRAVLQLGLLGVARQPVAGDGADILVQQPRIEQLADQVLQPTRGVEMVHVGQPVGIDLGHQWRDRGDRLEILELELDTRRTRHGRQVQHQVGRAAGGHQADHAVDEGLGVENVTDRAVIVAELGDLERAGGAGHGQRVAQRRVGVDEGGAGQVQPHELHQHLVRVRGAVEGAGARAMIGGHLGLHQRVAPDLAGGVLLAHLGFLVIRQARGHRAGGQEDAGDVAESGGADHQARHDLVADAEIDRRVIGVVRQRHAGRQRDHIAREQRQLHADLALRDPVAHRRHAAGHLCGAAAGSGRIADDLGKTLERLMCRQHVVVGRHDAEVGGTALGQRALVLAHGSIGMGLVAAGQMRPSRALVGGAAHAVEIGGAAGLGPGLDGLGNLRDRGVERHGSSPFDWPSRPDGETSLLSACNAVSAISKARSCGCTGTRGRTQGKRPELSRCSPIAGRRAPISALPLAGPRAL
ncbi:hypothetical protein R2601_21652 [Salipiger bermudensis HTCC2601]|uniref:Uncharacterized protein n=1 Tax=Salipiger bermudensis (strain DSM 26914 / JCM 13377 / KCTC 12554 / HTCC2601) TaxID=314265 RepID=Q0FNY4_SALBH|nr:hypothetical protein R2601_21652 [Salipiger bermudensis HTCC2601]